jgi:hypothetical protein
MIIEEANDKRRKKNVKRTIASGTTSTHPYSNCFTLKVKATPRANRVVNIGDPTMEPIAIAGNPFMETVTEN